MTHIQLALDHTSVWYLQEATGEAKELIFYPSLEEIFDELCRQSNIRLEIPPLEKWVDQPMVKPLNDAEKEEHYEVQIHLNTFTLYLDHTNGINPLGMTLTWEQQPQDRVEK